MTVRTRRVNLMKVFDARKSPTTRTTSCSSGWPLKAAPATASGTTSRRWLQIYYRTWAGWDVERQPITERSKLALARPQRH